MCSRDADCNAPHGWCTSEHRCRCDVDVAAGRGWGGWNCTADNARLAGLPVDTKYRQALWARHYGPPYSNLSQLRTAEDSERELPWSMSRSGQGSGRDATFGVRFALPWLIRLLRVESILDVPCGDFNYMRHVLSSSALEQHTLSYTGMDLVHPLVGALQRAFGSTEGRHTIRFTQFDLSLQMLWPADLVVMRDLLFHFSRARILRVLQQVSRSGSRFFLSTFFPSETNSLVRNGTTQQRDLQRMWADGGGHFSFWPVNLAVAPFALGPPLLAIGMDSDDWPYSRRQRVMGLWALPLWERHGSVLPP